MFKKKIVGSEPPPGGSGTGSKKWRTAFGGSGSGSMKNGRVPGYAHPYLKQPMTFGKCAYQLKSVF